MADGSYEVILDGGGPWGFRLQGGKDFGTPLNVSRVTPGSKAALKQMMGGDVISEINGVATENLSHMEAQNHIKNAGSTLQLRVRKGAGTKILTQTNVVHSANVDHSFNPKPKPFGAASSPVMQTSVTVKTSSPAPPVQAPKFDPGAYARKKKEELEQRKKEQSTVAGDSDILKMINATTISKSPSPTPASPNDAPGSDPGAFRMVYSGRDIHEEVSPGSKSVIDSLKDKVSLDKSGLNSESKVPSRVFQMLQKQLDDEESEELPPPPPELIDEEEAPQSFGGAGGGGPGTQSRTFKMLQDSIGTENAHQSVFSRPPEERNKAVPMPTQNKAPPPPQITTVNAIPKAPMPSGPNFKISAPKAPTFRAPGASPQNTYKPPSAVSPSNMTSPPAPRPAPSFQPSTSPQSVNSPQVTTAKVARQKPAMPMDPSRTPICHGCGQEIRGPFVSAIGKTFHPEHFACNSCKNSLQNQGFVEEQDKMFCETCYNSFFAPKCAACGNSIIGVGNKKTRLCSHCTNVRSTGEELRPSSLRDLILELKSDITYADNQTKKFNEMKQAASMRVKTARWKQAELKQKIYEIEERRDRIEDKIAAAEKRLDDKLQTAKRIDNVKFKYDANVEDTKLRLVEGEAKVAHAKKWGKEIWSELSSKLAKRSQLHYHVQFIEEKTNGFRMKISNLEEQLQILSEKRENVTKEEGPRRSAVAKKEALIEQYEDDIERLKEKRALSEQHFLTMMVYKDSLTKEISNLREQRRDFEDQLGNALRMRENKIIRPNLPQQFYR